MILCIQTDSAMCIVSLRQNGHSVTYEWHAQRELAKGLLAFVEDCLKKQNITWNDVEGLVVFRGPGSFTGLRIGVTVANTIAYARDIPVVGESGDDWQDKGERRLRANENDKIVLPEYGRDARITQPRK